MSIIPGGWELMIILVIVLIVFGAGKLPKVMGDLGRGVKSFKKGMNPEEPDQVASPEQPPTIEAQAEREETSRDKQG